MIHIYIKEKGGKFQGINSEYPDIKTVKDTYGECRDYMVKTILKRQSLTIKEAPKKKERQRIGFAA